MNFEIRAASLKMVLAAGMGIAVTQAFGQPNSPAVRSVAPTNAIADPATAIKDPKERLSYAFGMNIGSYVKRNNMDIDPDVLNAAIKDILAGRETRLNEAQSRETLMADQRERQMKHQEEQRKLAEKNRKAGDDFLAENAKKPGVKVVTAELPGSGGKTAEWQYKVLTEGTGPVPGTNDSVVANYRGTTIDGKEFDNSAKRRPGSKIRVSADMPRGRGFALEKMPVGSKWEVYLPSSLAFGDRGGPGVEPGALVTYEVESVSIDTPQPLTSDIIRVPSADGLKKGEKVQVLKPEDVARMTNTNSAVPH